MQAPLLPPDLAEKAALWRQPLPRQPKSLRPVWATQSRDAHIPFNGRCQQIYMILCP